MAEKPASQNSLTRVAQWFHPRDALDRTFQIGVVLKGLDGIIEVAGAILLLFVRPVMISRLADRLTRHELAQDPDDFLAGHILQYARELAGSNKWFVMLFLFSHGMIKIILVVGLLHNLAWAYPFAFATLGMFTVYQLYLIAVHPTIGMTLLTLFDFLIIWLTWREYKRFRIAHE